MKPPKQLPARYDVEATSKAGKESQHGQVGIGLGRKADQMRHTFKGLLKDKEVVPECSMAVQVKGGAHTFRNLEDRNILTKHMVITVMKVMHGRFVIGYL